MITQAIIAEYNPFHNGHKYHLEESLKKTGADYTIALMSGNFLQRGTAAMWDKYTRAKMSIACGIDLVLELPFPYATGSARDFAGGAVNMINALDTVDYLCFGAETDNEKLLGSIVDILANEPEAYSKIFKAYLADGMSYPAARERAICDYCNDPEIEQLMSGPNNILAIEYMLALKKTYSKIKPVIIKRVVSNYHDSQLTGSGISSATAIRNAIKKGNLDDIALEMPEYTELLINKSRNIISPVLTSGLTPFVQSKLICGDYSDKICDMSGELCSRMSKLNPNISYEGLVRELKTKNITETRIKRSLIHMLIGYTEESRKHFMADEYVYYANILGFRKASTALIRYIKDNADIPMITKKADAISIFEDVYDKKEKLEGAKLMWEYDMRATRLYNCLIYNMFGTRYHNDYTIQMPIV